MPSAAGLRDLECAAASLLVRRYARVFPARLDQVRAARRFVTDLLADCPTGADAVLCLSELTANAVIHSSSGKPGGAFAVRAEVLDGCYVRIEVHDAGGPWGRHAHDPGRPPSRRAHDPGRPSNRRAYNDGTAGSQDVHDDGRPHGLDIVASLAAEYGVDGSADTGWISRITLDWEAARPARQPTPGWQALSD